MEKTNKGGRPKKEDKEKSIRGFFFRMKEEEESTLMRLMQLSDSKNKTRFIKDRVFKNQSSYNQSSDKDLKNYYLTLTKYLQEYHAIGVNFNQLVRKVNSLSETSGIKYDLKYELNATVQMFEKLATKQEEILDLTSKLYKEWSAK
ncbi:hypothetical protein WG906_18300 [Pedobacter sp. P351]|uniref:plasmid mobilization protein n=1 Tax=Pedobacter superstes TaxID=3133441 RepID=UPI0030A6F714